MLKVCLFGSYVKTSNGIPSGNGGELLKKILKTQDVHVIECHEHISNVVSFFKAYVILFFKHFKLDYDVMVIPWRGILTLPLAKLIHRKPIIYFPAFSIYDTMINDRKIIKKNSIKAKFIHFADKTACKMADKIILETKEDVNFFIREYNLPSKKFSQLPLSADESIFVPNPINEPQSNFIVLFFGSFIPLHGIEIIIESAHILNKHQEIMFIICGDGQTKPEMEKLIQKYDITNIKLTGFVSINELLNYIKKSDVCLAIFGKSDKARRVLSNKVYQSLASKKPIITMHSLTAQEAHLQSGNNCILVPPSNPTKLADAIIFLKDNFEKRQQIALAGHQTYLDHFSMAQVGKQLVSIIQKLRI